MSTALNLAGSGEDVKHEVIEDVVGIHTRPHTLAATIGYTNLVQNLNQLPRIVIAHSLLVIVGQP